MVDPPVWTGIRAGALAQGITMYTAGGRDALRGVR
jgi:hypothetical protein